MLKLKKLQILGFKSFCDRTELKFLGEGIAAIIGPNGCGKSNIADAIAWVLGEQSAKTLRGSRMEDVIFAGTRDRKPTGMAEVCLTLIDPEVYTGADGNEPTEVEIRDELPDLAEDWDEEALRAQAAEETERAVEQARPGKTEQIEAGDLNTPDPPPDPGPLVVLKIRRRKFNPQQFRAGEVSVTRRLFRSGESEYLLNGKLCRLRDIQEIFMGTGLGPESYALIEQGRIGQILSSRPTDRRAIIEEAAGITKFKTKKRLAEARLEDARMNLSRVNDIFDEVTRQMNSLKRQASKAERYVRLREEMRSKLRILLASKFTQLDEEITILEAQLHEVSEAMRSHSEAVGQLELEHSERTQRGYAIDHELRENGQHIASIALEISRAQERRRHNEERCQQLVVRAANSENELQQVAYKLAGLQTELDANRQVLHSAAQDLAAAHREEARAREEAASTAADLTQLESQQEQSRTGIMQLVAVSADLRNQLTQAEERRAVVDRDRGRVENELASACSEQEVFGGQRGQLVLEFESVSQKLAGVSEAIAALRQALECKRTDERESKRRLDGLRAEYATASGRKNSLQAIIAEHGYSTESVRRLFQSGGMQGGLAPAGVLADFVEVESHYEGMVEDFLRDELNYVVVKSWDAADEGLRLLRSDVDGRATFLVHPNDAQAKFSFTVEERAQPATPSQGIVPLRKCLRVLDGFGKSLEVIMPKLRDGYIVPDSSLGRELALRNPDAFFLSAQSGECFHNVTVTGGKQRAEGPLSLKRELRDLVHLVSELERALCLEDQRVVMLGKEISEFATRLEGLEEERRNVERQAMTSGHMLEQLDSEMTRLAERKRITEQELCRLNMDGAEQQNSIASIQDQLARLELRRAELEGQITTGQAALVSLRARRDSSTHNASQHMARVATLEERHRAAAQVLSRIESLVRDVSERAESLRLQHESSLQEKQERELENRQLSELLIALAAQRNATEAREGLLQSESEQVRTRLVEIEESVRLARQTLDQARDRRGELSANAAKLQADAHYMAETCRNELGIERHELMSDKSLVMVNRDQLIEQDTHYREMRTRLEAMGPVNMMALEEYKETAERHAFLETQRKDLLDSIENTVATIKEIDSVSRQKFEEAFHRINANFQHTFQKLFGGGQAFMRLTDEENSADSGIDVVASPPGKKLQNVLLLSGGEKALTALSLLVGIFQYQPSPFCILDEVDAPLDEANVGRFTELVKEMSVQTQFVLITHSKKTMSVAPVMYGITMQEPGVSKLVSVRLGATA